MKQPLKDFKQLADSLKADNLEGAQKAYAAMQQHLQSVAGGQSGQDGGQQSGGQIAAFQQLGAALESGDLAGAQKAFASIMQGGTKRASATQTSPGDTYGSSKTTSTSVTGRRINVMA
jgi:hypothetical protein